MLYRLIRGLLAVPVVHLLVRPRVEGLANVPRRGPVILAANHLSLIDPVLVSTVVARPINYVVKSEFFTGTGPRGRATGAFFRGIHQLPVDRSGGTASAAALTAAEQLLAAGEAFGIFPEGTRSPDGLLHRGRTGVARIALATGAPVVPVGLVGTDRVLAPRSSRIRLYRPTLRFGSPLVFPPEPGADRERLYAVTDEVMAAIAAMSGQQRDARNARDARDARDARRTPNGPGGAG